MPQLIKDHAVCEDTWKLIDKDTDFSSLGEQGDQQWLVPLSIWLEHSGSFTTANTGVWIDSDEGDTAFSSDTFMKQLARIPLVAIHFPTFMDGRGYSYARTLRERYKYNGELRAIGDVLQDQLFFLKRCGFNAYDIRDDRPAEAALVALNSFEHPYQAAIDKPSPLFKRH